MNASSFRILFLMDPYRTLNLDTETSLLCMDELMLRGHEVYWMQQEDLMLHGRTLSAHTSRVRATSPFALTEPVQRPLDWFDAIVIRKDPPFDAVYLHLTYMLDFLPESVVAINAPAALRAINEKLSALNWAADCPDTLVTMNAMALREFVHKHGRVVIKPLDDCSGRGILFVNDDDPALPEVLHRTIHPQGGARYVLAQEFLGNVRLGDKRVYVVNGVPAGWVNRVPATGKDLANIHQGATCHPTTLSARERSLATTIGAWLAEAGVLLAGLDFSDGRLTEINVTSPSAVRQINAVSGIRLEQQIVTGMLDMIRRKQGIAVVNQAVNG
jgi:glutathione synthase